MARQRRLHLTQLEDRTVPSGLPATWDQRGSGGGGALFAPAINPANGSDIWISSDMSQLFHSTNAGASWQTQDFRTIQGGHETRVLFTENPLIRYTLDYTDPNGSGATFPSKSVDGGQTWQHIANDPTGGGAFYFVNDVQNSNRLLVSDYTHLYFSGDGGATWNLRYTTSNTGAGLIVGGAFFDGLNIFVGTNAGLLVSSNGGTSFAAASVGGLPSGQSILSFAGAKVGTTTRFAAVTYASGSIWAGIPGYELGGGGNVITLDWGASNWTTRTLAAGVRPFYAGMAINDIGTMYVAGGSSSGAPTVYKSTNGGASWASSFQTTNNQNIATGWSGQGGDREWGYGELALGFAVSPTDSSRVVITDFGFAHGTSDGGSSWQAFYVNPADRNAPGVNIVAGKPYHSSGLDNTTSWGVTWADSSHLYVSNSDIRGQISLDGGQTFGFGYSGQPYNSMFRVVAHPNGNLYGAAGSRHDMYQSTTLTDALLDTATGAILFSTTKGSSWQVLHDFGRQVAWVAADPTNAERLYAAVVSSNAAVGGIWVTNNLSAGSASTWTKLPNAPRTQGHPFNIVVLNDGTLVVSYSARRAGSPLAFTASSGVFASADGGQTWADRSAPGLQYWTKDVVVDPHDLSQNTWLAGVFSGWGGPPNGLGGLYRTTDRGATWTRILNLDRVGSATYNPNDPNELFVTTETNGLWYSNNIRSANPTFTQVAAYPFRQPERVFFNPFNPAEIWVTSFGNGLRVGTTAVALTVAGTQVNDGAAQRSRVTSLQVTFSTQVTFAGAVANAFTLSRIGGGAVNFNVTASIVGGVTVVTINGFTGGETQNGSLRDGRYTLTALASQITAGGLQLNNGVNYTFGDAQGLFRFYGDINGDRRVDIADFGLFSVSYLNAAQYNAALDFNGDGRIDVADFGQFSLRYLATLP